MRSAAFTAPGSSGAGRQSSRRSRGVAEAPPIPRERFEARFDSADSPLIALAEALLRARALDAGLAYELIASRSELEAIVGASRRSEPEPPVRTLEGWRAELVGADLRDLLAGRSAVSIGADGRLEAHAGPLSSMTESVGTRANSSRERAYAIGRVR